MSLLIDGDPNGELLVIGMAPGNDELREGRPFVGPSGNLLWQALSRGGLSRADCFIMNTIGEFPARKSGPSPAQFAKYWEEFNDGLRQFTGRVVLVLGGDALYRFANLNRINDWRGYVLLPTGLPQRHQHLRLEHGHFKSGPRKGQPNGRVSSRSGPLVLPPNLRYVIPTLHPAAVIRTGYASTPALFFDCDRACRAVSDSNFRPLRLTDEQLPVGNAISFDIENTRTPVGWGAITDIALAAGDRGSTSSPWGPESRELARILLSDPERPKVGFNLAHDVTRLRNEGVDVVGPYFDCMLAAQLLQPDLYKSLNATISLYLDAIRHKHLSTINMELYNRLDAVRTLQLVPILQEQLQETGQTKVFETEMRALPHLINLQYNGIQVDRDALLLERARQHQALMEHTNRFSGLAPGVNPSSNPQLFRFFYDLRGYPKQKKGKEVTLDEAAIRTLLRKVDDPALGALLGIRVHKKNLEYLALDIWPDNCVHPNYLPASKDTKDDQEGKAKGIAGTGRIQARDPNIQQIPKSLRHIFIPPPGHIFLEADYDAAELRVMAGLAGDRNLLRALEGPDLHQHHAVVWNCTRDEAKTTTYAVMYGASAKTLQLSFARRGVTKKLKDCQALINSFFKSYPQVAIHRDFLVDEIQREKRLVNPFGRHRFFWHPAKDIPKGLDFFPQSCVADIVWDRIPAVAEVAEAGGGALRAVVHDSVLVSVPADQGDRTATALRQVLEKRYPEIAPEFYLPVKIKQSYQWGSNER